MESICVCPRVAGAQLAQLVPLDAPIQSFEHERQRRLRGALGVAAMSNTAKGQYGDRLLVLLTLGYLAASLLHFSHNAEYLRAFPNLPEWISRTGVYGVWLGISAIGALGYLLYLRCHPVLGLILLGLYAAAGFDGLLHYSRAPFGAHSATMNFTILFEVAVAAILLIRVVVLATRYRSR